MSNESKALELASRLTDLGPIDFDDVAMPAAAELRRQHAEIESLRAQLAARVPDGCKLVPVEPTDAMVQAAHHLDLSYMPGQEGADRAAIYRAMLSAAPSQQAPQEQRPTGFIVPTHFDPLTGAGIPNPTTFGKAAQQVPAQECEWTNCPRRVGDVCCNEQQAPVAQGEPVGVVDAVSEHGFHVEFSVALPVGTKLYTAPQQASEPMTVISEEAAWSLAQHVYGRSQPYDAPQILLTPKELKTIIESAWSIKGKQ